MSDRRVRVSDLGVVFGVAILYVLCAKLGLALAIRAEQVSAVWPPTGFALAATVIFGRRAIPGIFVGAFVANATAGEPMWVAAGVAAGNTLEAIAGAKILSYLRFETALARLRDVLALFAAAVIAPCVSATIGVGFLVGSGLHPSSAAWPLWSVWWIGDALGALIVAPVVFVWSRRDRRARARGFFEPLLMFAAVIVAGTIAFALPPGFPAEYLIYPVLIWSALRLGTAYTATAALIANAIAVTATINGHGPFAGAGPESGLVMMQLFMAVGAGTALILGAVSEQSRAAHERAAVSEQRLLMAMSGARVGVWEWNMLTGEVMWSEGLEPLHGLPPRGFAGTYEAYRKLIHPDDVERVEGLISHAVESRSPYEAEFRLCGLDGVTRWTSARGVVLQDDDQRPVRMIGVGIDVTQQKELEEELRLQHRRKDEFLAMLGHELRNPLAAIVHAVDLLPSGDAAESEEARRVIARQTRNLSRLVDDLLDVARITRGQITLERQTLALRDVVDAGVDVWRHLIAQKRQRLVIAPAPRTLAVDGDATRLTQALANLVHNAAKFTPEGGAIDITMSAENGSALVRVRDDGSGMTPDLQAHAFELFVQANPPIDRQQGGLGLGLTLVRRLVEMHGGSVEVMSAGPGRGTEVVVRLPLAQGMPAEAVEERAEPALPSAPGRRVLVVEDNPDARAMLVLLLRRDGHDVRAAGDGHTAISEAAKFAPEIVLLDVGLPGMDGFAVARELRAAKGTSEALLVALTGYGQPEDVEAATAAGFDHHLLKPVEIVDVLNVIRGSAQADYEEQAG